MRVGFEQADFDALADLWGRCVPPKYQVDSRLLQSHTIGSPVFDWGASCIAMRNERPAAFVAVKRSASPKLYRGADPDQAHITAIVYEDPQTAVDLMAHTKAVLRDRGVYRLIFGQDSRHIFPGCPMDWSSLRDFLIIEGFQEGDEVNDLERDLRSYEPPSAAKVILAGESSESIVEAGGLSTRTGVAVEVRPVTEEEIPLLRILLSREFPGRWSYDVFSKIEAEGGPEAVSGLFVAGACEGFALTQREGDKLTQAGAVWRHSLGDHWCAVGPIGVSRHLRGQGLGDLLLAGSLARLRDSGAERCIIDWTNLADFYRRHGFEVTRTYRSFELRLDV